MPCPTKAQRKLQDELDAAFKQHGSNIQFNMLDIGKMFNFAKEEMLGGKSAEEAMEEAIAKYRQN